MGVGLQLGSSDFQNLTAYSDETSFRNAIKSSSKKFGLAYLSSVPCVCLYCRYSSSVISYIKLTASTSPTLSINYYSSSQWKSVTK